MCVLLWHYGSPDRAEEIIEFLRGIVPASQLDSYAQVYLKKYTYVGWSPQNSNVRNLASRLEDALKPIHRGIKVFTGSKHWRPSLTQSLEKALEEGFSVAVVVPLVPFDSRWLLSDYAEALTQWENRATALKTIWVTGFYRHPQYISNWVEKIRRVLGELNPSAGGVAVTTSFHAIPLNRVLPGETYLEETKWLGAEVASRLPQRCELSYQSAATTRVKWSKPSVVEVMTQLGREGYSDLLVAPMGFVYDHLETIFDVDVVLKEAGIVEGVNVYRVAAPNDSPWFARMLADIVGSRVYNHKD